MTFYKPSLALYHSYMKSDFLLQISLTLPNGVVFPLVSCRTRRVFVSWYYFIFGINFYSILQNGEDMEPRKKKQHRYCLPVQRFRRINMCLSYLSVIDVLSECAVFLSVIDVLSEGAVFRLSWTSTLTVCVNNYIQTWSSTRP